MGVIFQGGGAIKPTKGVKLLQNRSYNTYKNEIASTTRTGFIIEKESIVKSIIKSLINCIT